MKKAKNIILLIGICMIALSAVLITYDFFSSLDYTSMDAEHNFYSYQLPMTAISALLVLPILLFVRNLMGKTRKVLPIVSIAVNSVIFAMVAGSLFAESVSQYVITNEIGLTDNFADYVLNFTTNSTALIVVSLVLIIVGSALSLIKKKV
jgi:hypothetical protein